MSLAIRQGEAMHRLLEWAERLDPMAGPTAWQLQEVWPQRLLAPFGLSAAEQLMVWQGAQRLLGHPGVRDLMGLTGGRAEVYVEREWLDGEGRVRRPDRLIVDGGTCRILDYKWRLLPSELADYEAQLRDYVQILRGHHRGHDVQAFILTAGPEIWRLEEEGLVHWSSAGRPAL